MRRSSPASSGLLAGVRVILALGAFGWDAALRALAGMGHRPADARKPRFGHGAIAAIGPYTLVGSYHPSQQNTFTGRLTPAMFDAVIDTALRSRAGHPGRSRHPLVDFASDGHHGTRPV